ncbi:MAG: UbiA family prenyltransferase [Candidatus Altiarchaeota archaeon]|nr:UbiA family prenyltransferase [Candidatus Altiarchaeota archaeon]
MMNIRAIFRLMRPENCLMASVAVAIGFIVAGGLEVGLGLVLALVSAFVITGAGNTINDFYDARIDKENAPDRPIPSGEVTEGFAFYMAMSLFFLGILSAFFINPGCLILAWFNSSLLFVYARDLKGTVLAGNITVSYLTASTFVYGGLVLVNPLITVFLFLLAFLVNVGREIVGDIEDVPGDKKEGLVTLPIRIGEKKSWIIAAVFVLVAVALSPAPYLLNLMGPYYLVVVLVADLMFIASLAGCKPRLNQKLTKVGIAIGLVSFLAGLI